MQDVHRTTASCASIELSQVLQVSILVCPSGTFSPARMLNCLRSALLLSAVFASHDRALIPAFSLSPLPSLAPVFRVCAPFASIRICLPACLSPSPSPSPSPYVSPFLSPSLYLSVSLFCDAMGERQAAKSRTPGALRAGARCDTCVGASFFR